jgi:hypothetical protein
MKTLDDLRQFYNTELLSDLKLLEAKRLAIIRKLAVIGFVLLVLAILIYFGAVRGKCSLLTGIVVTFVIWAGILGFLCKALGSDYVTKFKTAIIRKIVKFVDESLDYVPHRYIPKSIFMTSEIFKTKPNRYKGDDYVSGKVGATKIVFSEVHAEYKSGGKNSSRRTIFKGLLFIADFNKRFTCQVVVLPDTAEKLFGSLGKILQSWNLERDQLVKLEDPEFEKLFVVYGNDQIQARYILSTSLMERIIDFKRKTNRPIYLSFVGSRIFVAISYTKDLFEPGLLKTLTDFELIREYFEDLQLAISIVDNLNLNTRIWSKQ